MSDFVNPKKRSIDLPPGCKELIDLIPSNHKHYVEAEMKFDGQHIEVREGVIPGTCADISQYIGMGLTSKEQVFSLTITGKEELPSLNFHFMKIGDDCQKVSATVTFASDYFSEQAMRDFFAEQGLQAPTGAEVPASFEPTVPVLLNYSISPLPLEASAIARIIHDMLREVFRMGDDSRLNFVYCEVKQAEA